MRFIIAMLCLGAAAIFVLRPVVPVAPLLAGIQGETAPAGQADTALLRPALPLFPVNAPVSAALAAQPFIVGAQVTLHGPTGPALYVIRNVRVENAAAAEPDSDLEFSACRSEPVGGHCLDRVRISAALVRAPRPQSQTRL